MDQHHPEILAPAGDRERLEAAVLYGADAVYLGGKRFGMRSAPTNFDPDSLKDAVEHCHRRGVKVYLTCNTLPTNQEAEELPDFLRQAQWAGVDALIVADVGILLLAKRLVPDIPVHISTQAGVVNYLTAQELHGLGASRVVLARELNLDEIRTIRDKTPPELEIEAFVHGAMCVSFSGRCLLSNYLVHRDGNRGECAQPCRWGYHLMEEKRPGLYFPIYEDEGGSFILNAQDLCMLPYLDRLADAGITSFKIEGRAKSAYYVAVTTNAYRLAADLYKQNSAEFQLPEWLAEEIQKVSHRQYSTGFYFREEPPGQYYKCRGYVRNWDVMAVVDGWEEGFLLCSSRNRFFDGETLELVEPGRQPVTVSAKGMLDEENQPLPAARHPMMRVKIPYHKPCTVGSMLRREREGEE